LTILNVLTCRSPSKKPRLWEIMQLAQKLYHSKLLYKKAYSHRFGPCMDDDGRR